MKKRDRHCCPACGERIFDLTNSQKRALERWPRSKIEHQIKISAPPVTSRDAQYNLRILNAYHAAGINQEQVAERLNLTLADLLFAQSPEFGYGLLVLGKIAKLSKVPVLNLAYEIDPEAAKTADSVVRAWKSLSDVKKSKIKKIFKVRGGGVTNPSQTRNEPVTNTVQTCNDLPNKTNALDKKASQTRNEPVTNTVQTRHRPGTPSIKDKIKDKITNNRGS